jgi:hypothetical protein
VTLCLPCAQADAEWRDARPAQGGIAIHTMVRTVRDVTDARRRRMEDHYELVRWQRDFNARLCAEGKHATPKGATS